MIVHHYVEEPNLSIAWARALQIAATARGSEVAPLMVIITGFGPNGDFQETPAVRQLVDHFLDKSHLQPIDTVANTIFPKTLWNPDKAREHLFQRYQSLLPRLRRLGSPKGTYFERMISGGPETRANQLDFAISTYKSRKGVRRRSCRSAYSIHDAITPRQRS